MKEMGKIIEEEMVETGIVIETIIKDMAAIVGALIKASKAIETGIETVIEIETGIITQVNLLQIKRTGTRIIDSHSRVAIFRM